VTLPTVSDNTSAEAGVNQLFTTSEPLCFFLEKIGQLSSYLNVDMDTSHISGIDNSVADLLSRWDFESPLPPGFTPSNRAKITLADLWMIKSSLRVVPPDLQLLWSLPNSKFSGADLIHSSFGILIMRFKPTPFYSFIWSIGSIKLCRLKGCRNSIQNRQINSTGKKGRACLSSPLICEGSELNRTFHVLVHGCFI